MNDLISRCSYCRGKKLLRIVEMAISDYEPNEAAAIVLDCKLVRSLTKGKSEQISQV
jgi:hypothetical protein